MPNKKGPTQEDMRKAEREIGRNLPDAMVGVDDGDVRNVQRDDEDETASRH